MDHYILESNRRRRFNEWRGMDESHPKGPKMQHLVGKIMTSVFWDAGDIIFFDQFEKGNSEKKNNS